MSFKECPHCGVLIDERFRYCECGFDWDYGRRTAECDDRARWKRVRESRGYRDLAALFWVGLILIALQIVVGGGWFFVLWLGKILRAS